METQENKSSTSPTSWTKNHKGLSAIKRLYDRFDSYYPNRFKAQFKTPDEIERWLLCWAEELEERGVTFDEAGQGLSKCAELYDWPPSFPEFLKACRPTLDPETAFYEAVEQMQRRDMGMDTWSQPVIYWASRELGNDMLSNTYKNIERRWRLALDKAEQKIKSGEIPNEVPKRRTALEAPKKEINKSSEVAQSELAKIKTILEEKPAYTKGQANQIASALKGEGGLVA